MKSSIKPRYGERFTVKSCIGDMWVSWGKARWKRGRFARFRTRNFERAVAKALEYRRLYGGAWIDGVPDEHEWSFATKYAAHRRSIDNAA